MKKKANMKALLKSLPGEIYMFYKYISSFTYGQHPNYKVNLLLIKYVYNLYKFLSSLPTVSVLTFTYSLVMHSKVLKKYLI